MEFSIENKDTYTVIAPVAGYVDVFMAKELAATCNRCLQNGARNIIADLQHCSDLGPGVIQEFLFLNDCFYESDHSLVFTGMNAAVLGKIKKDDPGEMLNLAPSMAEAIDVVSMEILERDLMAEDEMEEMEEEITDEEYEDVEEDDDDDL